MSVQTIRVELTKNPKEKPNTKQLQFGEIFTDHMFVMDYEESKGWYDPQIIPYQPVSLEPSAFIFHYGQSVFEGLKAYVTSKGEVQLFRPDKNFARMNHSNERLCIPPIDESFV